MGDLWDKKESMELFKDVDTKDFEVRICVS